MNNIFNYLLADVYSELHNAKIDERMALQFEGNFGIAPFYPKAF